MLGSLVQLRSAPGQFVIRPSGTAQTYAASLHVHMQLLEIQMYFGNEWDRIHAIFEFQTTQGHETRLDGRTRD
jgi:hypothetical protein